MIYLNIYDDKTCHNKINNIFTNFFNKTNAQTWSTEVNKYLYFGREVVENKSMAMIRLGDSLPFFIPEDWMCKEPTLPKYARKANDETTNVDKGGFVVVAIDLSASSR